MTTKSKPGPAWAYISPEGLKKLDEYKYVSAGYTVLDKAMQPFWCWFVEFMPLVSREQNHFDD